jgi:short-subunit dehydrogenase
MKILILGATSGIAQAYARRRAARNAFVLAGRHEERLKGIAADLVASGATSAESFVVDLAAIDGIEAAVAALRTRFGDPDEVVIAYGHAGEREKSEQDIALARLVLDTNFTSAALWALALLKGRAAGPFTIIAIGSVAGDRGRGSNFVYGSSKGGFDRFFEGLAHKYAGTDVHILRVKPGYVDTPMTAGMTKTALFATPDKVAADIERAVTKRRQVLYTPWFWWLIMLIIRNLPWFVFRRLKV